MSSTFYVIAVVLYGVYSIYTQAQKKKAERQPPSLPNQPQNYDYSDEEYDELLEQEEKPAKGFMDSFLKELEKNYPDQYDNKEEKPWAKTTTSVPPPLPLEEEPEEEAIFQRRYETYDYKEIERHNLDDSPKTHKDDQNYERQRLVKFAGGKRKKFRFNFRDAIIYNEILTRKYK